MQTRGGGLIAYVLVAVLALAGCNGGASPTAAVSQEAQPSRASATVTVDSEKALGTVEPRLFGANLDFAWNANGLLRGDGQAFPQAMSAMLALGIPSLRGPGGSYADTYDWKKGTGSGRAAYGAEYGFGTPEFLALLEKLGAQGLLTANFNSGTPATMTAWMQEVARTKGRVSTWEIGNEIYGDWEKGHTDAANYAKRFLAYAVAARKAQPGAKLAIVLAPTLEGGGQDYGRWNATVLPAAGSRADVGSVHLYSPWHDLFRGPSRETSLAVMAAPEFWAKELERLVPAVKAVRGAGGKPLELWVTEWNTQHGDDHDWKQRNVTAEEMVFVADMLRVFVEQGVDVAQFYNLFGPYWGLFDRQGATADRQSMLMLSFPPARKPEDFRLVTRPAAHVFDLWRPLRGGTRVASSAQSPTFSTQKYGSVPAQSGVATLSTIAVKEKSGALSMLFVNRSLDTTLDTSVRVTGAPAGPAELLVMGGRALDENNEEGVSRVRAMAAPLKQDAGAYGFTLLPASVARLRLGAPESGRLVLP